MGRFVLNNDPEINADLTRCLTASMYAGMANSILPKLDADIAKQRAIMAAAQTELERLTALREYAARYEGDETDSNVEAEARRSLASRIEELLFEVGPLESSEIYNQLSSRGIETTQNSVNTTVSRMKVKTSITNEEGKWDLTLRRRKQLSR